jgi:hypothetical protein
MPSERRQDYPQILEKLDGIRQEMAEVKLNSTKIATLVEERNNSNVAWRGELCKKFDKIFAWLEGLPCKERGVTNDSRKNHVDTLLKLLWGALGIIFTILVIHLGWK